MLCPKCHSDNPGTAKFCLDCGAALSASGADASFHTETMKTPVRELSTGATFAGRYQIIEELGKGGMGRVYKVFDTKVKEKVALKLIKPEVASDPETVERFSNELKLARKIRHKNVCGMFDLGEAEGAHFITMEYVSGEDLKSMIRMSTGLTVGTALSVGKQICDGLAEAHAHGVVHRDLKPQNIMIDKGGHAKIMDFGIARSLAGKGITGAGVMIGTPEYMSPEQAEAKDVDARSDIYSLGVMLYEMATGRVPFEGETALGIAMKHKSEAPKNPKQISPHLPDDLAGVILKCLQKDRTLRYQTAGELGAELDKIEKGIPTTERVAPDTKAGTSRQVTVSFSPRKLLIPALAVIALIVIAAIFIPRLFTKKNVPLAASEKPSLAVLPFVDLSPQKDQEYFCDGMADELINRLSNIRELRVPARTSVFTFKGKAKDLREIGKILNVGTVLEGSVRKAGHQLHVTARLSNAADDSSLWTETYDRELKDVDAVQVEIAQAVVAKLKLTLLGEEKAKLEKHREIDPAAYEAYLRGLYHWWQWSEEGMKNAVSCFRRAIEIEPKYAPAYAGLALAYNVGSTWMVLWPPLEGVPQGKKAAQQAIHLDPALADGYIAMGISYLLFDWDRASAEKALKKALELNPNSSMALDAYANLLVIRGHRDEAVTMFKKALDIDPLSAALNYDLGWAYWEFKQFDLAIPQLRKALELDRTFLLPRNLLAWAYFYTGRSVEAAAEFQTLQQLAPDLPWVRGTLGYFYGLTGRSAEAKAMLASLDELARNRYVTNTLRAVIYLGLGQKNEALDWLEKAAEEKDGWIWNINIDPWFDPLRSEPRFQALLKKVGF